MGACGLVVGRFAVYEQRRSAMDSNKPAQNIQDSFLKRPARERLSITIYLLSGVKLTGRIRSFDKYSVVLEANGQEQLIFKHAISTVVMRGGSTVAPGGACRRRQLQASQHRLRRQRLAPKIRIRRFRFGKFSFQEILRRDARGQTCASRQCSRSRCTGPRVCVSGGDRSALARTAAPRER